MRRARRKFERRMRVDRAGAVGVGSIGQRDDRDARALVQESVEDCHMHLAPECLDDRAGHLTLSARSTEHPHAAVAPDGAQQLEHRQIAPDERVPRMPPRGRKTVSRAGFLKSIATIQTGNPAKPTARLTHS